MADPQSLPPVEAPASERDYKPVSGVAVAAILTAGLYVVIVLATAFPLNELLLFLPAVGLFLAIAARIHIRRSEGARTGLQVAAAAWWLSVLGGVGYGAYYLATVVALRQQSDRAASEWFDFLKNGEVDRAFLLTLPPLQRQSIDPNSTSELEGRFEAGPLPLFRNSELVRFFRRNGKDAEVKSIGASDLEQFENGVRINVTFLLMSPEGKFEISLVLIGTKGEGTASRDWQIGLYQAQANPGEPPGSLTRKGLTAYGWLVSDAGRPPGIGLLPSEANYTSRKWLDLVRSGDLDALLETLPAAERPAYFAYFLSRSVAEMLPPYLVPPIAPRDIDVAPGDTTFDILWKRDFFNIEGPDGATATKKNELRTVWSLAQFVPAGESRLQNPETAPTLAVAEDRIEYTMPLAVRMLGLTPEGLPRYAKARIILAYEAPDLVNELQKLKAEAKANPVYLDRYPVDLFPTRPSNWRVLRLETDLKELKSPPRQQGM